MPEKIRVLLADKSTIVRAGLRAILSKEDGLISVREAINADDTQLINQKIKPDVLLFNLNIINFDLSERETFLHKLCLETKVLILSIFNNIHIQNLVEIGVAGCVSINENRETLANAIRTVAKGHTWFNQSDLASLGSKQTSNSQVSILTKREQEVSSMIAQGWDNITIANQLSLAEPTVRNYISRIYSKIGVNSRAEAVVWARERNLNFDLDGGN
jgi:DNA-binding NarL/FixJ family response regulator